jgi:Flp pilus assembly protein TadD
VSETGKPDAPPWSRALLSAAAALFVLIHLLASLSFPETIWGASHLRYLGGWGHAVLAVAVLLVAAPPGRRALVRCARGFDAFLERRPGQGDALLFAGSAAVFLLFRTRNLFLGDGYLIASVVQNPEETGIGAAGFVSLALHRALLAAIRVPFPGAGGEIPFVLTSALAGACVVLLARSLSRELAGKGAAGALFFLSIVLSGGMLLFFGYVEHYSLMQAALLLYFALAIRFLRGRGGLLPPTAALLLAMMLHISSVALAPAWVLLLARDGLGRRKLFALLVPVAFLGVAGAYGLLRYTEKFYSGLQAVVPLLDKGIHAYSFFSAPHLAFVLNETLLLLGGALLFLPLLLGPPRRSAEPESHPRVVRFLGVSAGLGLLYLLFVDPMLGARDWDLMALPLFPWLLLLGYAALGRRPEPSPGLAALLAVLLFFHAFPWVAAQLDRDRAVAMTVAMTVRDPHYANPEARAPKSFGVLLARAGYDEHASRFFEKAVGMSEDAQNLYNLGTSKAKQGEYAEAASLLESAIRAAPGYRAAYANLAWCRIQLHELERAEAVLRSLLAIAGGDAKAHRLLGIVQVQKGEFDAAIRSFETAVRYDPEDGDAWERLGLVCARQGRLEEAERALRRALAIDPNNEQAAHALRAIDEEN